MVRQRSAKPFTAVQFRPRPPKFMYYVYVLLCSNKDLYIGYSEDLKSRVECHLASRVKSTKSKQPLKLVYYEAYLIKSDARKREIELKNHQPKNELKRRLINSVEMVSGKAENHALRFNSAPDLHRVYSGREYANLKTR